MSVVVFDSLDGLLEKEVLMFVLSVLVFLFRSSMSLCLSRCIRNAHLKFCKLKTVTHTCTHILYVHRLMYTL